jgi:hypothetical protein
MLPGFLSRMASLAALATRKLPVRFTLRTSSQSSRGIFQWKLSRVMPA